MRPRARATVLALSMGSINRDGREGAASFLGGASAREENGAFYNAANDIVERGRWCWIYYKRRQRVYTY